jgi:hypothetical protein
MKITIDTKEDSKEEIKKVIGMLSALVGGNSPVYTNSPFSSSSESSIPKQHNANIFSDEPKEEASSSSSSEQPSGSIFGNIFGPVSSEPSSPAGSGSQEQSSEPEEPEKKPEIQIIDY